MHYESLVNELAKYILNKLQSNGLKLVSKDGRIFFEDNTEHLVNDIWCRTRFLEENGNDD